MIGAHNLLTHAAQLDEYRRAVVTGRVPLRRLTWLLLSYSLTRDPWRRNEIAARLTGAMRFIADQHEKKSPARR